jgi:hypothetical protein
VELLNQGDRVWRGYRQLGSFQNNWIMKVRYSDVSVLGRPRDSYFSGFRITHRVCSYRNCQQLKDWLEICKQRVWWIESCDLPSISSGQQ